jgi:hypothetical protein
VVADVQAIGRMRLGRAREALECVTALARSAANDDVFRLDVQAFAELITLARDANSALEYGDQSIAQRIGEAERRLDVISDAQQTIGEMIHQMSAPAIDRDIDALKATFQLVEGLKAKTNGVAAETVTAEFMHSTHPEYASVLTDGKSIVAAGRECIREAEAAAQALAALQELTGEDHTTVSLPRVEAALQAATEWSFPLYRKADYDAAVARRDAASRAQKALEAMNVTVETLEQAERRPMDSASDLRLASNLTHTELHEAKQALARAVECGANEAARKAEVEAASAAHRSVEDAWKARTRQRLVTETKSAWDASPLFSLGFYDPALQASRLQHLLEAFTDWWDGDAETQPLADEARLRLSEYEQATASFQAVRRHCDQPPGDDRTSSHFLANNQHLEELVGGLEALRQFESRLGSIERQTLERGRSTAKRAEEAMGRRQQAIETQYERMRELVRTKGEMGEVECGRLREAIDVVSRHNAEFALANARGSVLTLYATELDTAKRVLKNAEKAERRRQEKTTRAAAPDDVEAAAGLDVLTA